MFDWIYDLDIEIQCIESRIHKFKVFPLIGPGVSSFWTFQSFCSTKTKWLCRRTGEHWLDKTLYQSTQSIYFWIVPRTLILWKLDLIECRCLAFSFPILNLCLDLFNKWVPLFYLISEFISKCLSLNEMPKHNTWLMTTMCLNLVLL